MLSVSGLRRYLTRVRPCQAPGPETAARSIHRYPPDPDVPRRPRRVRDQARRPDETDRGVHTK